MFRLIALVVLACLAPVAIAQQPGGVPTVDLSVEVFGKTLADFSTRMDAYAELVARSRRVCRRWKLPETRATSMKPRSCWRSGFAKHAGAPGRGTSSPRTFERIQTAAAPGDQRRYVQGGEGRQSRRVFLPGQQLVSEGQAALERPASMLDVLAASAGRRLVPIPRSRFDPARFEGQRNPGPHRRRD